MYLIEVAQWQAAVLMVLIRILLAVTTLFYKNPLKKLLKILLYFFFCNRLAKIKNLGNFQYFIQFLIQEKLIEEKFERNPAGLDIVDLL
jgi:hypothetical protein